MEKSVAIGTGASQGIGRSTAIRLARFLGARLVARDRPNLEDTAEAVKAAEAKAPYAAVGTINAAIVALAKAFSDRGVADGVQANSVLPGPAMTGRRRSYLEHWAPLHATTVEQATANSPRKQASPAKASPRRSPDSWRSWCRPAPTG
jgi:NAD(P)-dependent dehydrogenase (short-subunit alcohol dehydrogenase family)